MASSRQASISIIVPTLNERETIVGALTPLQRLRGKSIEIVVIDGRSADDTIELARPLADRVEISRRGRAAQMNTGALLARGDVLLFLHADTRLPPDFITLIQRALDGGRAWGRFNVRIDSRRLLLRIVARMMNARSRLSGIATGDQAIFVRRGDCERIGGFPDIPLMEDIALSKSLKRLSWPAVIPVPVLTSARRWERDGIVKTIILMWSLRWAYFWGADPAGLAIRYEKAPRRD
ncbi:MAG: TIGR04283 family arsenosugar biosynthesis glycosyltransferase [Variibacter sp.]